MDRRDFMIGTTAALASSQARGQQTTAAVRSQFFTLRYYKLHQGDQGRRMNDWMSKSLLPAMKRHGFGTIGVFNVSLGPTPTIVLLTCYQNLAQLEACWVGLSGDADFQKSMEAL